MPSTLVELEHEISTALQRAGRAFAEIRERKLFKHGYRSWEAYCTKRWGTTANYVNRLIRASDTSQIIHDQMPDIPAPELESHCRPLYALDTPELQLAAWLAALQYAQDHHKPITAEIVRLSVEKISELATVGILTACDEIVAMATNEGVQASLSDEVRAKREAHANGEGGLIRSVKYDAIDLMQLQAFVGLPARIKEYQDGRTIIIVSKGTIHERTSIS